MGYWNINENDPDPIIYGQVPSGSYAECDISSIVGERVVVAVIRSRWLTGWGAGDLKFAVRPKGDNGKYYDPTCKIGQRGFHSADHDNSAITSILIAITNEEGIFEYTGSGVGAQVRMYGWFIPTSHELKDLYDGVMPIAYTDVGSESIDKNAFMFLRCLSSTNNDKISVRKDGSSYDHLTVATSIGGVSSVGDADIADIVETLCVKSAKRYLKFEQISDNSAGGPPTVDLDCIAYENEAFVDCDVNIVDETSNYTSWNLEVDLNPYINDERALCIFRVGRVGGASSGKFGVRPRDDINDGGHIDFVTTEIGRGCSQAYITPDTYGIIICPVAMGIQPGWESTKGKVQFYIHSSTSSDRKTIDLIGYIPEYTDLYVGTRIRDYWFNNLSTPISINVLGYSEADEEFPHDIYSYFLSSIRKDDVEKTRLFYRWLYGMQQIWESMYAKILALPDLYSPDNCPAEFLEYLKDNVGVTDDLNNLWGVLTENEKRRLIKYFVYYIQYKGVRVGIIDIIKSMTGRDVELLSYFDMRWILSGNTSEDNDLETAIGREDLGYDQHLLSEYDIKQNYTPDAVTIAVIGGEDFYEFTIDSLISDTLDDNPPVPPFVRLTYIPTKVTILAPIYNDGNWKARAPADYYFDQSTPYSTTIDKFYVGFDLDAYVFDLKVVDDGTINHEMIIELVKFSRPSSEKVYIRYFLMIDKFSDVYTNQWDVISGILTHDSDNNEITLNGSTDTIIQNNLDDADTWTDYCVGIKARSIIAEKYFEIRTMVQDTDNYLYLQVEPNTVPHIPAGTWIVGEVVAGIDTPYTSGNFDWFDLNVDYFWRMVCVVSQSNIIIQCYYDENLFYNGSVANPFTDMKGRIELMQEAGGECVITHMEVHPFPMESDYISA